MFAHPFQPVSLSVRPPPTHGKPIEQPNVEVYKRDDSYIVTLTAPQGQQLIDIDARPVAPSVVRVEYTLVDPPEPHEYVTRRRTGIYASPHTSSLTGVIPAHQRIVGGPPSSRGWIALEDEEDEAWVLDDGSLALVSAGRPAAHRRASKEINVPRDAAMAQLNCQHRDGGIVVTLPCHKAAVQIPVQPAHAANAARTIKIPVQAARASSIAGTAASSTPAWRTPSPRLSLRQLREIQDDCMADDIPIESGMERWSEDQVREFFESGGMRRPPPVRSAPAPAAATTAANAMKRSGAPNMNSSATPAPPQAPHAARKPVQPKQRNADTNHYDTLLSREPPLLVECTASAANVQSPVEKVQEWEATKLGGFVRTA